MCTCRKFQLSRPPTCQVGICQLHTLHVVLLIDQLLSVLDQDVQGHGGLLKVDLALTAVDQALANVLNTNPLDEVTDLWTTQAVVALFELILPTTRCATWYAN